MNRTRKTVIKVMVASVAVTATVIGGLMLAPYVAYPAFAERMNRLEVLDAMSRMEIAQQAFRLRNGRYSDDASALGFDSSCTANCVYLVSLEEGDTRTFRARFIPNPAGGTNGVNQIGDEGCQSFTVDAGGRRAAESESCLIGR